MHRDVEAMTIGTRALSSTKPSARYMALAKCFNSCMQEVAKGLGPGRDRDEANVILTCTAVLFNVQRLIAATTLVCCIELHTVV